MCITCGNRHIPVQWLLNHCAILPVETWNENVCLEEKGGQGIGEVEKNEHCLPKVPGTGLGTALRLPNCVLKHFIL